MHTPATRPIANASAVRPTSVLWTKTTAAPVAASIKRLAALTVRADRR